jgi:MFS superfamily sulfate permease-like transporter
VLIPALVCCLGRIFAPGIANFISGACCGLGGCALIGTTMINVSSGGRSRLSVFCAGTTVLLTFIVAYKAMNLVPLAALAGVMFMIVIHTFAWPSLVTLADALCYGLDAVHVKTTRFQLWLAKYRPACAVRCVVCFSPTF